MPAISRTHLRQASVMLWVADRRLPRRVLLHHGLGPAAVGYLQQCSASCVHGVLPLTMSTWFAGPGFPPPRLSDGCSPFTLWTCHAGVSKLIVLVYVFNSKPGHPECTSKACPNDDSVPEPEY